MTNPFRRDQSPNLDEYFALEAASTVRHEYVHGRDARDGWSHAATQSDRVERWSAILDCRPRRPVPRPPGRGQASRRQRRLLSGRHGRVRRRAARSAHRGCTNRARRGAVTIHRAHRSRPRKRSSTAVSRVSRPTSIIEQERRLVVRHWREGRAPWQCETIVDDGETRFTQPALSLTFDEIYEGVEMPSPRSCRDAFVCARKPQPTADLDAPSNVTALPAAVTWRTSTPAFATVAIRKSPNVRGVSSKSIVWPMVSG